MGMVGTRRESSTEGRFGLVVSKGLGVEYRVQSMSNTAVLPSSHPFYADFGVLQLRETLRSRTLEGLGVMARTSFPKIIIQGYVQREHRDSASYTRHAGLSIQYQITGQLDGDSGRGLCFRVRRMYERRTFYRV